MGAAELPPVPEHVPPELVYDFDLFSGPEFHLFADDLHGSIGRFAAEQRDIIYTPRSGGHWVVVGRDAAFDAATNVDIFTSDPLAADPNSTRMRMLPINLDAPEHTPYRKIFSEIFSAREMNKLDPVIRSMAIELIEKVVASGRSDYAKDIAEPLPVLFFMKLMGFPLDRFAEFRVWVLTALSTGDPQEREAIWANVVGMSTELIKARQIKREDDLISRLLDVEIEGRQPSLQEMQAFCVMLFVAGLDTVTNAMGLTMRPIAMDPDLQQSLRENPSSIPLTLEELMRRYTGNTVQRYVRNDATFRGAPLKRGDSVMIFYPSADLDPRAFDDPETIDVKRRASHLAFGAGPHRCVGAQLARIELKIVMEEWLKRVPAFAPDPDQSWHYNPGYVIAVESLPLVWDASAVPAAA